MWGLEQIIRIERSVWGLAHEQCLISVSGDFDALGPPYTGGGDRGRAQLGHARCVVSVTVRGHLPTRKPGRAACPVAGGSALLPPAST